MTKKQEIALDWMNRNFHPDNLEQLRNEKIPNSIFYKKDGILVIEYDLKSKKFYFDYNEVWSFFNKFLNMSHKEIRKFLVIWLEMTFNSVNNMFKHYYLDDNHQFDNEYEKIFIGTALMKRWKI